MLFLKSLNSVTWIRFNFFNIIFLSGNKLKISLGFFNSAHIFLNVFWPKNRTYYLNSCRKAYTEDKWVLFFSQESWDDALSSNKGLSIIINSVACTQSSANKTKKFGTVVQLCAERAYSCSIIHSLTRRVSKFFSVQFPGQYWANQWVWLSAHHRRHCASQNALSGH